MTSRHHHHHNNNPNKSPLYYITLTLCLFLILTSLFSPTTILANAKQSRFLPIDATKPTDPTEFWVEMDLPDKFFRGMYNNITIHLHNFETAASRDLAFTFGSSSPTFYVPPTQPDGSGLWCFDSNGSAVGFLRSQGTYFDVQVRPFVPYTVIPYLAMTCTMYYDETDPQRDNSVADTLIVNRYKKAGVSDLVLIEPSHSFKQPKMANPVLDVAILDNSVTFVPGGVELSVALSTPAGGLVLLQMPQMGITVIQKHKNQNKHIRPDVVPSTHDWYGRLHLTSELGQNELGSFNFTTLTHPNANNYTFALSYGSPSNTSSTTSNYCYLVSKDNDISSAIDDISTDWYLLPQLYQRSAVLTITDDEYIGGMDVLVQVPGVHVCRIFVQTLIGEFSLAVSPAQRALFPSTQFTSSRQSITTTSIALPLPHFYIENFSSTSISINYRLLTFKLGDLILLSKNANNYHTFQPPTPWLVDQTISPPTPHACLPFSLNATYIAWVYQPSYITIGSEKYGPPIDCTIALKSLPGLFQQEIDLKLEVLPKEWIPYTSSDAYSAIHAYSDIYSAIDMIELHRRVNTTTTLRILSANLGRSHFYSYGNEQLMGEMTVRDVLDVEFDPFATQNVVVDGQNDLNGENGTDLMKNGESLVNIDRSGENSSTTTKMSHKPIAKPTASMTALQTNDVEDDETVPEQTTPFEPIIVENVVQDAQKGYRSLSLTITPQDMNISGGSLYQHDVLAMNYTRFIDIDDMGNSIIPKTTPQTPSTTYSTQPLHLVLDLDREWMPMVTGDVELPINCYAVTNGAPKQLKIAWGNPALYPAPTHGNHYDDYTHRLFVQLPEHKANQLLNLRCQIPLPIASLIAYPDSRIEYWLQPGTVLETHVLDIYNKHAGTNFTSLMDRKSKIDTSDPNTTPTPPIDPTTPKKPRLIDLPMDRLDIITNITNIKHPRLTKQQLLRKPTTFTRDFNNLSPTTLNNPLEMITYANVSFIIDYGDYGQYNNTLELQNVINNYREFNLHDFILPIAHFTPFSRTNYHILTDIPVPILKRLPTDDPKYVPYTHLLPTTTDTVDTQFYQFALVGELKTASINIYNHILTTFVDLLFEETEYLGTSLTREQLLPYFSLADIRPFYGTEPFDQQSYQSRFIAIFDDNQIQTAAPLNGVDGYFDQTRRATRLVVTIAAITNLGLGVRPPSWTPLDTNAFTHFTTIATAWGNLYKAGKTPFLMSGRDTSATGNALAFRQCLCGVKIDMKLIPLNATTGDYNSDDLKLIRDEQIATTGVKCGGICDLLCPDMYTCTRHEDCFHGNCNTKGYCGPSLKRFNFSFERQNDLSVVTYSAFIWIVILGVLMVLF
jgi:hypothetical protein